MNHYLPTDFAFTGTTVDPEPVRSYLLNMKLGYYEAAYQNGHDEDSLKAFNYTEVFEIRFKRYLSGFHKTLHLAMADVRAFVAFNPLLAPVMIKLVIIQIRRHFLKNEWYELMPRFEKAAAKIEKLLNQPTL